MHAHDETNTTHHTTDDLERSHLPRRNALAMIGLGAAVGGLASLAHGQDSSPVRRDPRMQHPNMGFDSTSGQYVLPALPYPYEALEPHIDAQTMQLHHDKHHAGYVKGLNSALAALEAIRTGKRDASETQHWQRQLAFHGSGHFLHVIFWNCMSPQGGGSPSGALAEQIERDFGSFRSFSEQFQQASNSVEGSGWGLLVFDPVGAKLLIMQAEKHQNQAIWGTVPLLAVDVWEHAYYLKYQNRRSDYTKAFMNVANWEFVARELDHVKRIVGAAQ